MKNGQRIYALGEESGKFEISHDYQEKASLTQMGKDITGDGEPDLVIWHWSGGAHCCYTFHVFQIGKEFRKIAMISVTEEGSHFTDLDGDSNLEFVTGEGTFDYWRFSYAGSPHPEVILRFRDGAYRLAGDLMRKPAPTLRELATRAREVRDHWKTNWKTNGELFSELCSVMLDLIYTGHAGLAWQFFEMAWLPDFSGKDAFLSDFRTQLSTSPYWSEVKALSAD